VTVRFATAAIINAAVLKHLIPKDWRQFKKDADAYFFIAYRIIGGTLPKSKGLGCENREMKKFARKGLCYIFTRLAGCQRKGHASKMQGIKANFVFNVLGTLASLVVAFVTVPIYVSHIGAARYGVVSIVWLLLGYFGFLDLGLSRASVNALSKLKSSSQEERSKVLITTFSLNLALGTLGGLII
jgi:hypothetical protein